jgi:hypothetical protein
MHPCIDRVIIVSTASVGTLKKRLPIAALEKAFHSFKVVRYTGRDRRLQAKIIAVGAGNDRLWTAAIQNHASGTCVRCELLHTRSGQVRIAWACCASR